MKIQFGFGKGSMDVNIPDGNLIRVLTAKEHIHGTLQRRTAGF